jgi:hypothetical protein
MGECRRKVRRKSVRFPAALWEIAHKAVLCNGVAFIVSSSGSH